MSDKHTPGRLRLEQVEDDSGHITHLCPVDAEDMSILTVVDHEGVKFAAVYHSEDARRLVACWNACLGMSTAGVETVANLGGIENKLRVTSELVRRRDELLVALKELVQVAAHLDACQATVEMSRAAIAKAEAK